MGRGVQRAPQQAEPRFWPRLSCNLLLLSSGDTLQQDGLALCPWAGCHLPPPGHLWAIVPDLGHSL